MIRTKEDLAYYKQQDAIANGYFMGGEICDGVIFVDISIRQESFLLC